LRPRGTAAAALGVPPDLDDLPAADPPGGHPRHRGPAPTVHCGGLPDRRLAGAGDLRHVRHHLRRTSGADPDPDAGRLGRAPAAQGLPARRDSGGIQGRGDPAARSAEVVLMIETEYRDAEYRDTTE